VSIGYWFQNAESEVSAHYVIGRDGSTIQCVREADAAWSNGHVSAGADEWWRNSVNPNLISISIELVKPHADNSDEISLKQRDRCFELVREICQRWKIPARQADQSGGITGHFSMDPANRSRCPGPFPWPQLWQFLDGGSIMSGVPQGWKDDGSILSAPNGYKVQKGFREFILKNNWQPDNMPLMNEAGLNPVELGNPGLGGGTVQAFRHLVLAWTAKAGVYVMWGGQEWVALHKRVFELEQEIKKMQAGNAEKHLLALQQIDKIVHETLS
jgi:hypothetical protein